MSTLHRTFLNFKEQPIVGEINNSPSLTQPNEVLSIKELLARHLKGIPVDSSFGEGTYLGDDLDIPDIRSMDLSEIEDMRDQYRDAITRLTRKPKPADLEPPKPADPEPPKPADPIPPTPPTPPTPQP